MLTAASSHWPLAMGCRSPFLHAGNWWLHLQGDIFLWSSFKKSENENKCDNYKWLKPPSIPGSKKRHVPTSANSCPQSRPKPVDPPANYQRKTINSFPARLTSSPGWQWRYITVLLTQGEGMTSNFRENRCNKVIEGEALTFQLSLCMNFAWRVQKDWSPCSSSLEKAPRKPRYVLSALMFRYSMCHLEIQSQGVAGNKKLNMTWTRERWELFWPEPQKTNKEYAKRENSLKMGPAKTLDRKVLSM